MATTFKKGSPAECGNYRPISLISIGYKLFATTLLQRLRDAGAEQRVWRTQFDFRRGYGTADALFMARRRIEQAWESRDGTAVLLALDWAKAFDCISPSSLAIALERFGLPAEFVDMAKTIYTGRTLMVRNGGSNSEPHRQYFGISQGCPLSPFLFAIVMTVLISHSRQAWQDRCGEAQLTASELIYADDILLIDGSGGQVQKYMHVINAKGSQYELTFNWKKLEQLNVKCDDIVTQADGEPITSKQSMLYLGSLLSCDGRIEAELGRRLGACKSAFETPRRVWSHANIYASRKMQIFNTFVVTKRLYGLHGSWLNVTARKRLDGFQARCLRRCLGIAPAYWPRVPNTEVLRRAGSAKLTTTLIQRQLQFFGKAALSDATSPLRTCMFQNDSLDIVTPEGPRPRGRPRCHWPHMVRQHAGSAAGDEDALRRILDVNRAESAGEWEQVVRHYIASCQTPSNN